MLTRYLKAAMQQATYQQSADGQSYYGAIPALPGVSSQAATRDACRMELRNLLETWLLLGLCRQLSIPPMHGIPLAAWIYIKRGV
jgi:predicted RNase H-like HicB family nuclease